MLYGTKGHQHSCKRFRTTIANIEKEILYIGFELKQEEDTLELADHLVVTDKLYGIYRQLGIVS